jgi:hypothetical protein
MPEEKNIPETEDELFRQSDRDLAELYPTPEAWERSYPLLEPPDDPHERMQYEDFRQLYHDGKQPPSQEGDAVKERDTNRINKATRATTLTDKISAGSLPATNDRTKEALMQATQDRMREVMERRQTPGVASRSSVQRPNPSDTRMALDKSTKTVTMDKE